MKKLLIILSFFLYKNSFATTYYFSATGDDNHAGTSASSPFQTLAKANSLLLYPGDQILFKRGDVFSGLLSNRSSGSTGHPIIYGAYDKGANPVISGFSTVSSWTDYGGGIYYSSVASNNTMIALLNGNFVTMGRTPNTGRFYYYNSHSGKNNIGGTGLSGIDWTGAHIVMRNERWIIDNFPVTAHNGANVIFDPSSPLRGNTDRYSPRDKGWFFFQNDIRTLDTLGEWYSDRGRFYMYFGLAGPAGYSVQVSLQDYNINLHYSNYITVQDIDVEGASYAGINVDNTAGISIKNVNSKDQGGYFIFGELRIKGLVQNCTSINALAGGAHLDNSQVNFLNCFFYNSGLSPGNNFSGDGFGGAIDLTGNQDTVRNCTVRNCGYGGIKVMGNDALVIHNRVDSFGLIKTDCGGIYTSDAAFRNAKIAYNIVSNGIGTGAFDHQTSGMVGIYCDNGSHSGFVTGNTVFNIPGFEGTGLYFQYDGHDWVVDSNVIYNCKFVNVFIASHSGLPPQKITFTNNVIVSTSGTVPTFQAEYYQSNQKKSLLKYADYNYYMRPIDKDGQSIVLDYQNYPVGGDTKYNYNLGQWKTEMGQDVHSSGSPKFITSPNSMRLVYNDGIADSTIALPYKYLGHDGKVYDGRITLAPFSSEVLIQDGNRSHSVRRPYAPMSGLKKYKHKQVTNN